MKARKFVIGAAALAMVSAGSLHATARADGDVVDADVGGGAAVLQVSTYVQSYDLRDVLNKDRITYNNAVGAVVLPQDGLNPHGTTRRKAVVNQKVSNLVRVAAGSVSIKGERRGDPFAEADTALTGVTIQGTDIAAIKTHCRWDAVSDPSGTTTIVKADGTEYKPAPNTSVPIPGLGELVLNFQDRDGAWVHNVTRDQYFFQEVLYVYGAVLRLDTVVANSYNITGDIILGFTSCDPVRLPNLSGLKLSTTSTDY